MVDITIELQSIADELGAVASDIAGSNHMRVKDEQRHVLDLLRAIRTKQVEYRPSPGYRRSVPVGEGGRTR
jgi:hypothetical protein